MRMTKKGRDIPKSPGMDILQRAVDQYESLFSRSSENMTALASTWQAVVQYEIPMLEAEDARLQWEKEYIKELERMEKQSKKNTSASQDFFFGFSAMNMAISMATGNSRFLSGEIGKLKEGITQMVDIALSPFMDEISYATSEYIRLMGDLGNAVKNFSNIVTNVVNGFLGTDFLPSESEMSERRRLMSEIISRYWDFIGQEWVAQATTWGIIIRKAIRDMFGPTPGENNDIWDYIITPIGGDGGIGSGGLDIPGSSGGGVLH